MSHKCPTNVPQEPGTQVTAPAAGGLSQHHSPFPGFFMGSTFLGTGAGPREQPNPFPGGLGMCLNNAGALNFSFYFPWKANPGRKQGETSTRSNFIWKISQIQLNFPSQTSPDSLKLGLISQTRSPLVGISGICGDPGIYSWSWLGDFSSSRTSVT